MVFQRVCNVVPGLEEDAEALAHEMQQRTAGVIDFSSCTETRYRARP